MKKEIAITNKITDACKNKRIAMQLSCDDLAKKTDCSRVTIWKFENNDLWPKKELLIKILTVLELDIILKDVKK